MTKRHCVTFSVLRAVEFTHISVETQDNVPSSDDGAPPVETTVHSDHCQPVTSPTPLLLTSPVSEKPEIGGENAPTHI